MKTFIVVIIVLVALVMLGWLIIYDRAPDEDVEGGLMATDTILSQSLSDGTLTWSYPSSFGLALNPTQILVKSYIPPCSEGFNYCLYYTGNTFQGTNFESAGIRIQHRSDLDAERICLNTPPEGYTNLAPSTTSTDTYSAGIFSPVGDAGAGHYANGEIYRVYLREANRCYEIETRIGETQFGNYEPGSIERFTEADRNIVYSQFNSILNTLKISSTTERIMLPASEN